MSRSKHIQLYLFVSPSTLFLSFSPTVSITKMTHYANEAMASKSYFSHRGRLAKLRPLVFFASLFHGWLCGPQTFPLWPCCWRCWGSSAWQRPSVSSTPCPRSSSPPSSGTWAWAAAPWLLGSEPSAPRSSFIWVGNLPVGHEVPPTPSPPLLPSP